MTTPLRVGILGGGAIADFHAPALREAGFSLTAVSSRPGSASVHAFAERHGVERVFDTPAELLAARDEWDALLISVPTTDTLATLDAALSTGAPILVEKPIGLRAADVAPLLGTDARVIVGYNRRFYRPVRAARDEVAAGPALLAEMSLPEGIAAPAATVADDAYLEPLFVNSVHGLDLARFVFGDLAVTHAEQLRNTAGNIVGVVGTLHSPRGDVVTVRGNWGTPANYALSLDRPGRRLELRPFERATVYEGMEVVEPTPEVPIRSYRPQIRHHIELDDVDLRFKPGFVGQAQAFASLCRDAPTGDAATLADAHAVLQLAEALVDRVS